MVLGYLKSRNLGGGSPSATHCDNKHNVILLNHYLCNKIILLYHYPLWSYCNDHYLTIWTSWIRPHALVSPFYPGEPTSSLSWAATRTRDESKTPNLIIVVYDCLYPEMMSYNFRSASKLNFFRSKYQESIPGFVYTKNVQFVLFTQPPVKNIKTFRFSNSFSIQSPPDYSCHQETSFFKLR